MRDKGRTPGDVLKFDPEDGRLRVGRDGARLLVGDGERGDLMEEVSFMYASSDASSKRIYKSVYLVY